MYLAEDIERCEACGRQYYHGPMGPELVDSSEAEPDEDGCLLCGADPEEEL